MLGAYGAVAAFVYGTIMNLQGWTYIGGMSSGISFRPGDPVHDNLVRFLAYCAATSFGWDLGRAALTVVLTLTIGSTVLKALRRATRRAAFEAPVAFEGAVGARGTVGPAGTVASAGPVAAEGPADAGPSPATGPRPGPGRDPARVTVPPATAAG